MDHELDTIDILRQKIKEIENQKKEIASRIEAIIKSELSYKDLIYQIKAVARDIKDNSF